MNTQLHNHSSSIKQNKQHKFKMNTADCTATRPPPDSNQSPRYGFGIYIGRSPDNSETCIPTIQILNNTGPYYTISPTQNIC